MQYLSIFTPDAKTGGQPPANDHMAAMGKLIEEMTKNGTLVTTGALHPMSKGGAIVRSEAGKFTVTDGPFAESKELIVGFAILNYESREAAIEGSKQFLKVAGSGVTELRQII